MSEINYKIILIGNSGVGKTSFFRKLSTGEFYEKNISTIGVEKRTLDLDIDVKKNGKKEKEQKYDSKYMPAISMFTLRFCTLPR